jgi:hypothetical protein
VSFQPQRDELFVELLASAVESKAGVRADNDDVAEFLAALGKPIIVETASSKPSAEPAPRTGGSRSAVTVPPATTASARAGKLILRGKAYPYHNARAELHGIGARRPDCVLLTNLHTHSAWPRMERHPTQLTKTDFTSIMCSQDFEGKQDADH